jgi:cation diffusion facilitator family transporter
MSHSHGRAFRPPEEERAALKPVARLEWISIAFMLTIVAVIGLAMGSSEAMKAVWMEDLISLVPPVAYLIGAHWRDKDPCDEYPYGYRRSGLIGYLAAAMALLAFGAYIFIDGAITLIKAQPPTIGTVGLWGHRVWLGWLMMAALVYSVIPPLILGRMKMPLARDLHQKALYTDASLNRGDWLTGIAGVAGLLGIAVGWWWADAVAALLISIEIVRDGIGNLKNSVAELMHRRPSTVEEKEQDPVLEQVEHALRALPWVEEVRVRLREDGDALTGELFVSTKEETDLLAKLEEATETACRVDWRLHDLNVVPVRSVHPR